MPLLLSDEQRQALNDGRALEPIEVLDPITKRSYVLMRSDVYRQFLALQGDPDPRAAYPLIDQVMADDDSNDPYLAEYQDEAPSKLQR